MVQLLQSCSIAIDAIAAPSKSGIVAFILVTWRIPRVQGEEALVIPRSLKTPDAEEIRL